MNAMEAAYYMAIHEGDDPLVGYAVEIRPSPNPDAMPWMVMGSKWPTKAEAREHQKSLARECESRIIKITMEVA